jgi:hypothetical protein
MDKCEFVGFRATADERAKISNMARATGMNTSELLRALVNNAAIQTVQAQQFEPVVRLASASREGVSNA